MQGGLREFAKRVGGFSLSVRRMSTEFLPREQKLLEADPALKESKSNKAKIELIRRIGDVLVVAVVAGSTYEIYYRVMARKAAQAESTKEEK